MYIVVNDRDESALRRLMRKIGANFQIVTMSKHDRKISDYESKVAKDLAGATSVRDCIDIENERVTMLLFENSNFDRVVIVENDLEFRSVTESLPGGGKRFS